MKKYVLMLFTMFAFVLVAEEIPTIDNEVSQNAMNMKDIEEEALAEEFDEDAIDRELSDLLPNEHILKENSLDNQQTVQQEEDALNLLAEEELSEEASQ